MPELIGLLLVLDFDWDSNPITIRYTDGFQYLPKLEIFMPVKHLIRKVKVLFILIFFALFINCEKVAANHLVGGELTYECLGANSFRINLIIYRDCYSDGAPFDNPAAIYLRNSGGDYLDFNDPNVFRIPIYIDGTDTTRLPINDEGLCTDNIPDVCVSRAIYTTTINLPPIPGGYDIVYQRCCRNTSIVNIAQPGETGSTYVLNIPHESGGCDNNSPVFTNFPPIVICDQFPILFDHSATDADGDSLVYELCQPLDGASANFPGNPIFDNSDNYLSPNFGGCNFSPDPINWIPCSEGTVDWLNGFSTQDPLGNSSAPLEIDPLTGLLTGTPDGIGQYVVGICVSEYRNGVLLSRKIRDFQFNVTDCDLIRAIPDADAIEIEPNIFQIINCDESLVGFDNLSVGAESYEWDFGIEGISTDVSFEEFPVYAFPDTGIYEITLIASKGLACKDTAILILKLYPTFNTEFDFDTNLCEDQTFSFTDQTFATYGNIDSWAWDFGDGTVIGPGSGPVNEQGVTGTFDQPSYMFDGPGLYDVTLFSTNDLECRDSVVHEINVYEVPEIDIEYDFLCLDFPVDFMGISNINNVTDWNWTFDDGAFTGQTQDQFYNVPGDYFANLSVLTDEGCANTELLNFTIYDETFADAGVDTIMCFGTSVQLSAVGSVGGAGLDDNSYEWQPSEFVTDDNEIIDPTVSPIDDQTFLVIVSDPNGCKDSANVLVDVLPLPEIDAGPELTICVEDSTINLNGSVSTDVIDFEWSPNEHINAIDILNPLVYPPDTMQYVLTGIDNNLCENSDTVDVNVIPLLDVQLLSGDQIICEGDEIQLEVSGGMVYEWIPSNGLSDPTISNPIANPTEDSNYKIIVSNPPCFVDTVDVFIQVNPLPFVDAGDSVTINIGESTFLNGMGDVGYLWTPSTGLSDTTIADPEAMPLVTTEYILTTFSDENCEASDSVKIIVENNFEVIIPTAFSPNGDGLHDDIGIRTRGLENLYEFAIFNRWGQKVFETNDQTQRWDGTFRQTPQELGVYVYYIRAEKFLGGEFIAKGNITLIR